MSKAGNFKLDVMQDGYPIWFELQIKGENWGVINALELRDLQHAVKQARMEAKEVARKMDPERVNDY